MTSNYKSLNTFGKKQMNIPVSTQNKQTSNISGVNKFSYNTYFSNNPVKTEIKKTAFDSKLSLIKSKSLLIGNDNAILKGLVNRKNSIGSLENFYSTNNIENCNTIRLNKTNEIYIVDNNKNSNNHKEKSSINELKCNNKESLYNPKIIHSIKNDNLSFNINCLNCGIIASNEQNNMLDKITLVDSNYLKSKERNLQLEIPSLKIIDDSKLINLNFKQTLREEYLTKRNKAIEYMFYFKNRNNTSISSLILGISLLDYLMQNFEELNIELTVIACFLISAKYNERDPFIQSVHDFKNMNKTKYFYYNEVRKYEIICLILLNYKVDVITSYNIIETFLYNGVITKNELALNFKDCFNVTQPLDKHFLNSMFKSNENQKLVAVIIDKFEKRVLYLLEKICKLNIFVECHPLIISAAVISITKREFQLGLSDNNGGKVFWNADLKEIYLLEHSQFSNLELALLQEIELSDSQNVKTMMLNEAKIRLNIKREFLSTYANEIEALENSVLKENNVYNEKKETLTTKLENDYFSNEIKPNSVRRLNPSNLSSGNVSKIINSSINSSYMQPSAVYCKPKLNKINTIVVENDEIEDYSIKQDLISTPEINNQPNLNNFNLKKQNRIRNFNSLDSVNSISSIKSIENRETLNKEEYLNENFINIKEINNPLYVTNPLTSKNSYIEYNYNKSQNGIPKSIVYQVNSKPNVSAYKTTVQKFGNKLELNKKPNSDKDAYELTINNLNTQDLNNKNSKELSLSKLKYLIDQKQSRNKIISSKEEINYSSTVINNGIINKQNQAISLYPSIYSTGEYISTANQNNQNNQNNKKLILSKKLISISSTVGDNLSVINKKIDNKDINNICEPKFIHIKKISKINIDKLNETKKSTTNSNISQNSIILTKNSRNGTSSINTLNTFNSTNSINLTQNQNKISKMKLGSNINKNIIPTVQSKFESKQIPNSTSQIINVPKEIIPKDSKISINNSKPKVKNNNLMLNLNFNITGSNIDAPLYINNNISGVDEFLRKK